MQFYGKREQNEGWKIFQAREFDNQWSSFQNIRKCDISGYNAIVTKKHECQNQKFLGVEPISNDNPCKLCSSRGMTREHVSRRVMELDVKGCRESDSKDPSFFPEVFITAPRLESKLVDVDHLQKHGDRQRDFCSIQREEIIQDCCREFQDPHMFKCIPYTTKSAQNEETLCLSTSLISNEVSRSTTHLWTQMGVFTLDKMEGLVFPNTERSYTSFYIEAFVEEEDKFMPVYTQEKDFGIWEYERRYSTPCVGQIDPENPHFFCCDLEKKKVSVLWHGETFINLNIMEKTPFKHDMYGRIKFKYESLHQNKPLKVVIIGKNNVSKGYLYLNFHTQPFVIAFLQKNEKNRENDMDSFANQKTQMVVPTPSPLDVANIKFQFPRQQSVFCHEENVIPMSSPFCNDYLVSSSMMKPTLGVRRSRKIRKKHNRSGFARIGRWCCEMQNEELN